MTARKPRLAFQGFRRIIVRGPQLRRRQSLPTLPLRLLIPNALTLLALAAGLTAIRFALHERFENAVLAILIAGIVDGMDGRIARLLNGVSRFGAELDSLSDFVSFGISPALVLYLWSLQADQTFGWPVVLFYAMCMALRLARFNTALDDPKKPAWAIHFFTGVPAPMGAAVVLLPLYADFLGWNQLRGQPWLIGLLVFVTGLLLVSRLPTPSFKRMTIDASYALPLLVLVVLIGALIANFPWAMVIALVIAYLLAIPLSVWHHHQLGQADASPSIADDPPMGADGLA